VNEIRLNKGWFLLDGNQRDGMSFHEAGIPRTEAVEVQLPHFTHMTLEDHVGISWYERDIELSCLPEPGQIALLWFEQADFRTEVSVNGKYVGEHIGAEDPFSFDVTRFLRKGTNRITVRVSKPQDEPVDGYTLQEIPHRNQTPRNLTPGSCYNESGLSGEVLLRILPENYLDDLYLQAAPETGRIRVRWTIRNAGRNETEAVLKLDVHRFPDGETEDTVSVPVWLKTGDTEGELFLTVPEPLLWSLSEPNLYMVRAELSASGRTHSMEKRTGFRTFYVGEDGYFYLNSERIYLKCSHTGNCMPESVHHISRDPELLRKDFLMAKAVGFNMIRFISGSALPLQMELCDEIGLMIYEEPLASWRSLAGPHMETLYRENLLTMIRRDRSHPSVTIWGLINEMNPTSPDGEVNEVARNILPELRKWDDSRLVLFSSGRWDRDPAVGSVSNPGSTEWQPLWGWDGDALSPEGDLGDIHYYPAVPLRKQDISRILGFGEGTPRPVFVSETGAGSALDTVSLLRRFEQTDAVPFAPDVKMIRQMNELFVKEIEKFGFNDVISFPSELIRGSMKNHVYFRTQMFDLLRSNPNLCGISLTGLLDHSICGEGLWTLFRNFKPGIADVLQDGFASLRWNVLLSAPAVYAGQLLTVQASLATEDVLKIGMNYAVRAAILGKDGDAYMVRDYSFSVTEEYAQQMVVPVFEDTWDTTDLPAGEYEFKAELLNGADASGGIRTFHICDAVHASAEKTVYVTGLTPEEEQRIAALGFKVQPLEECGTDGTVLAGWVQETDLLEACLRNGAHVIALRAAEEQAITLLPEHRRPTLSREWDWLYHRETVLRPKGRFFAGMRTGLADALLYTGILTPNALVAEGEQIPDETDAFVFSTGYPCATGFLGGYKLGSYQVGTGTLILNTFNLLDAADTIPYAARLLVNLLENA